MPDQRQPIPHHRLGLDAGQPRPDGDIGEAFFDELAAFAGLAAVAAVPADAAADRVLAEPATDAAPGDAVVLAPPDDPVAKSIARNGRRGGAAAW